MKQNGPLSEAAAIQMVEDTASVGAQFICIEIDNLYETVIERCRATGVEIVLPVWAGFEGLRERLTDLMHKGVRNIISPYPQNIEQLTNRHAAFSSSTV
jgi:methylmalonyl-CoA mutase cobalamin-binding subunit